MQNSLGGISHDTHCAALKPTWPKLLAHSLVARWTMTVAKAKTKTNTKARTSKDKDKDKNKASPKIALETRVSVMYKSQLSMLVGHSSEGGIGDWCGSVYYEK